MLHLPTACPELLPRRPTAPASSPPRADNGVSCVNGVSQPEVVRPGHRDRATHQSYTLLALLASGGMGEVYLADYRAAAGFRRRVAVKRLLPHLAQEQAYVEMFLQEARLSATLRHPNLCPAIDLGSQDGTYFHVMEYLHGLSLADVMSLAAELDIRLPVGFVLGVALEALEGLHFAHELADEWERPRALVHRDISPPNLFCTSEGDVKVLDFGIAKCTDSAHTRVGIVKGKAAYMSPEQVRAEPLDRRSDLFSLAVVMHEALSGLRLFRRNNDVATFHAVKDDPAPPLTLLRGDLPAVVEAVVHKALHKQRSRRWATARAFGEALFDTGLCFSRRQLRRYLSQTFGPELAAEAELARQSPAAATAHEQAFHSARTIVTPRPSEASKPAPPHAPLSSESNAMTTSPEAAARFPAPAAAVLDVIRLQSPRRWTVILAVAATVLLAAAMLAAAYGG